VLSFLKDRNGASPARLECQSLRGSRPREVNKVLAHLAAVDGVGATRINRPLATAQLNPGTPPILDLYWWEINGVGAFYAYDGIDTVVVLMGVVANPPTYGDLLSMAQGRI
jgi:hypothetical protein